jgi:DNA topoisomerase-1
MTDQLRLFAGDCTTVFRGARDRTQRGRVVVLVKPDRTVLVHDADGYQPVAWLTRPDALTVEAEDAGDGTNGGFGLTARAGDQTLRIHSHRPFGTARYPVGPAGVPVGRCPDCAGALARTAGTVACLDCETRRSLPAGATVLESTCDDCGLPRVCAERDDGAALERCLDPACASGID